MVLVILVILALLACVFVGSFRNMVLGSGEGAMENTAHRPPLEVPVRRPGAPSNAAVSNYGYEQN